MVAVIAIGACAPAGSSDAPPRAHRFQQRVLGETGENSHRSINPSPTPAPIAQSTSETPPDSRLDCQDPDACLALARQWDHGSTGPRDTTKARRYYAMACEGGSPVGCNSLGASIMGEEGATRSPKLAFSLFSAACRLADPGGCYNAGVCYEWGSGVEQNFIAALSAYEKACARGMSGACRRVAALKKWNWAFELLRDRPRADASLAEP